MAGTPGSRRFVVRALRGTLRHALRALLYTVLGGTATLVVVFVVHLERRPDLSVWHTASLDAEFRAGDGTASFDAYLVREAELFAQLDERVYAPADDALRSVIARYTRGSASDPGRWPRNWNRSFELPRDDARGGVLLVHGMSDSPYSLRALGQRLHAEGRWVLGLRVPGHGTAPVGLTNVAWEDMAAAVSLAVAHLRERVGARPVHAVGYSNGGALVVQHALASLAERGEPGLDGLVLVSPEIGVTALAALAVWQERLGRLLGLDKLQWNSILPEYDPFKYGSFALNAGKQAHRLTARIQRQIDALHERDPAALSRFPPTLAFQSVLDATVSAPALVEGLFARLPPGPHELVLFDINRYEAIEALLDTNPTAWLRVFRDRSLDYTLTVVTNESVTSAAAVAYTLAPEDDEPRAQALGLSWPRDVYSLSHVALPFAPDDPLYGGPDAEPSPGIRLGDVALRGERGALRISAADQLRIRWNPFYAYLEERALDWLGP